jgi:murein L,D-transpeptidase YcbB/YkuD
MNQLKTAGLLVCILAVGTTACRKQKNVGEHNVAINSDSLAYHIEKQFDNWTVLVCQDQLQFMDTLRSFYKARNYRPLHWDILIGDSASCASMDATFAHSETHGMDRRYYYLPLINYYRKKASNYSTSDSVYAVYAELELILSNSLLRMYKDIANGRSSPIKAYGYTYMLPRNNWKGMDYYAFLKRQDKTAYLDGIHKKDTTYQELYKLLNAFLIQKAKATSTAINFADYPKLVLGDTAPVIPLIIAKLKKRNFPNSSVQSLKDTNIYSRELVTVIKTIQTKYNLSPDGIMGYKTYKLINSSKTEIIDQVKANLERQRWFTKPAEKPFVYLNLPQYIVEMHWPDSMKEMKVCIGKNLPDNYDAMVRQYTDSGWLYKLPKNMETPQIASKITYAVLNPTWTVPNSIITREMWENLLRDPSYLRRNSYRVYRKGVEVQSDTIQWSKVSKSSIPYKIVESPGPDNSLGTVKFLFRNPFFIYLHDTPQKAAFNRTQRAVSHGCVRLEQPLAFGEFLMQNSTRYSADDFRIMMGYPPRDTARLRTWNLQDSTSAIRKVRTTSNVNLEKPMPLYLDYRTLYYDSNWKLRYAYDIYDQNKLILKEMDRM